MKSGTHNSNQFIDTPQITALSKIKAMVEATNELPSGQYLFYNLLRMTADINTFSTDLVKKLASDSELASQIINKAGLQGSGLSVRQIQQSIQRLGYQMVHNEIEIGIAKSYARVFRASQEPQLRSLVKASIRMAFLTKEFARQFGFTDLHKAFYAGLTFYLGQIVIYLREQRAFNEIHAFVKAGRDLASAEEAILGFEHAEVTARMIDQMGLPNDLADMHRYLYKPNKQHYTNIALVNTMRLAEYVCMSMTYTNKGTSAMYPKAQVLMSKIPEANLNDKETWHAYLADLFIKIVELESRVYV